MQNSLNLLIDNLPSLLDDVERFMKKDVLVGVPQEKTERDDPKEPTNAMLAYIHENGSPAQNIPARPFMRPGLERVKDEVSKILANGMRKAMDGHPELLDQALGIAGFKAVSSIKAVITEGLEPPLKPDTIENRNKSRKTKSRRKSEEQYLNELSSGVDSNTAFANSGIKPLINTGQLRNSITYVIRDKSNG